MIIGLMIDAVAFALVVGMWLGAWRGAKLQKEQTDYWHKLYIETIERDTQRTRDETARIIAQTEKLRETTDAEALTEFARQLDEPDDGMIDGFGRVRK
jgi:hypothetical protein